MPRQETSCLGAHCPHRHVNQVNEPGLDAGSDFSRPRIPMDPTGPRDVSCPEHLPARVQNCGSSRGGGRSLFSNSRRHSVRDTVQNKHRRGITMTASRKYIHHQCFKQRTVILLLTSVQPHVVTCLQLCFVFLLTS